VVELVVGLALIPLFSVRFGALGAAVLLLCFSAAIANAVAHGREPDCHCFGQLHSTPAGWATLARNVVLFAVAVFVTIAGWHSPGVSATDWVTHVGAPWLVAIAAGVVIAGLVGFQVWFSMQLLAQNGRTLGRLEMLESTLRGLRAEIGLHDDSLLEHGELGRGLTGGGLPVGAPAPDFELDATDGGRYSLTSLLSGERPVVLVFSAAGCGPCEALLPQIGSWQRQYRDQLQIGLITSGAREHTEAGAADHGLDWVLLQTEREVADAYQAHGTPMAVVISPDGMIASPAVAGAEAIETLITRAAGPPLQIRQIAPNGHRNGASKPAEELRLGAHAPSLALQDVDGNEVKLEDLDEECAVVLFWNPGCGFCQRMLPELHAFERHMGPGAPRLVVISAGEREDVREQAIGSRVVLDPDSQAMRAFGASGTPMAVLVEDGKIGSGVAAGASAVLALLESGARPHPARTAASSDRGLGP